jgi:DNA primase
MLRAQRVAGERKMKLLVAAMPAGEDPAEMIAAEGGAERFQTLIDSAVELAAFQIGLVLDATDTSSPAERDRALNEAAPVMAGMDERQVASREELERRVAERLDLDPATVRSRVVTAQPLSGGLTLGGDSGFTASGPGTPAPAPRRASAALTSRERRERALLAMCIAMPAEGKEYLDKLTAEHLSPLGARALAWLREHPDDPASNLPMDDTELAGLIAELVILANDDPASPDASNEPPSPEAMKLNFMLLEQRRLEAEISAAGEAGDRERRAALSMERAALVERIARTERVS